MKDFEKYGSLSDDDKVNFLFGIEDDFNDETLKFLSLVIKDEKEYDLARIEAIKSIGLCASSSVLEKKENVAKELIFLAKNDDDDDIRIYSLQSLSWLTDIHSIPKKIEEILFNKKEYSLVREAAYSVVFSQKNNPDSKKILEALKDDPLFGNS